MSKNNPQTPIRRKTQLSNPFSTGGGGGHFEAHVQASFVVLMLSGGYAPSLPCWPIKEIKLQGKIDGFETDDLIVFVENGETKERCKLLCQVKHSVHITRNDSIFSQVIQSAWADFNNPNVFTRDKDAVALVTGHLSASDVDAVQWLLRQARRTKDVDEFFRNVQKTHFSSAKSREKLAAIQHHLKQANNDTDVGQHELYSFLNHFHLLSYDLGEDSGIVLSLLHSHISQYDRQAPQWVWSRVVDLVQGWNQNGGTIVPERLPNDLKEVFKRQPYAHIPAELTLIQNEPAYTEWGQHLYAKDLALANLMGSWDEKNEADTRILSQMIGQDYTDWISKMQEVVNLPDSPVTVKNGQWRVVERRHLWDVLGSRIFDQTLDTLQALAVAVLTERDPSFDLSPDNRYAASLYGKVMRYSPVLRRGLAETLALLGNKSNVLVNCSRHKADLTAALAIRKIFDSADWMLWGSLNDLLPTLSEAAPDVFLGIVETALQGSPSPFDELFSQEGNGVFGRNYLTGLLWALEGLAWDETYLVRVCVILGELAMHDPGGKWINRPENSLITILLPWLPQTTATIEKRKVAVQTLSKECPTVAWKVILNLLPNQHQVSSGAHKPVWRQIIAENFETPISRSDYWAQVDSYAELATSFASSDMHKLCELVDHLHELPKAPRDQVLGILSSYAASESPEEVRKLLWTKLTKYHSRRRRFHNSASIHDSELLSNVEAIAERLAPSSAFLLYQYLFTEDDFDLSDVNGNWEEQSKQLGERRQKAVREVLAEGGIKSVTQFALAVESPRKVGHWLGTIATAEIDSVLLPTYLLIENGKLSWFMAGYVWSRQSHNGWPWIDGLDRSSWSAAQLGRFLSWLPFTSATWERVAQWLPNEQSEYWSKTSANPYGAVGDLSIAVDKLLEHGRPLEAVECIYRMINDKQPVSVEQSVNALLQFLATLPALNSLDTYHIVEIIKMLQDRPEINPDDLHLVEWAYLPLLTQHEGVAPKYLENRLASDPEFFCEIIRLVYRSTKVDAEAVEFPENRKAAAMNAWNLLNEWQTPPGLQKDGGFDELKFLNWLQRTKEICTESGHLEIGLQEVGKVLIYCPSDVNGLWINSVVADALNKQDAEHMRMGFHLGIFNSRGVHTIDPTGAPERELVAQYLKKAEDVENAGYFRFALTLKGLAETYEREARQIVADHQRGGEDI